MILILTQKTLISLKKSEVVFKIIKPCQTTLIMKLTKFCKRYKRPIKKTSMLIILNQHKMNKALTKAISMKKKQIKRRLMKLFN